MYNSEVALPALCLGQTVCHTHLFPVCHMPHLQAHISLSYTATVSTQLLYEAIRREQLLYGLFVQYTHRFNHTKNLNLSA